MKKRISLLLLTLVLLFPLSTPTLAHEGEEHDTAAPHEMMEHHAEGQTEADLGTPHDVKGHHAEALITKWAASGLIKWYNGAEFHPDQAITRAEFISLVNTIFHNTHQGAVHFHDVAPDAWYAADVAYGVGAGYISGEDEAFRPDSPVTREEAAQIIAVSLALDTSEDAETLASFSDAHELDDQSRGYIAAAVKAGYFSARDDGTFGAAHGVTRAETVALLDRVAVSVASGPNAPVLALTGWVLDRDCIGVDILKHTKTCNLMGSCFESGLGVYQYHPGAGTHTTAENYLVFDAESKQKTKAYLEALPEHKTNNISIRVTGYLTYAIPTNVDETNVPEAEHEKIDHQLIGLHVLTIESQTIEEFADELVPAAAAHTENPKTGTGFGQWISPPVSAVLAIALLLIGLRRVRYQHSL